LAAVFLWLPAAAEVKICGIQKDDLNFKQENNPYIITGDVILRKWTLWNINPGVVIKIANPPVCHHDSGFADTLFKRDLITIHVLGSFQCVGGSANRIVIEPLNPVSEGGVAWNGIVFDGTSKDYTKLFYANISGARCAVRIINSSLVVRNCILQKNQTAIFCDALCKSLIYNNDIVNNFSTGILIRKASPSIQNNLIVGNLTGLWSDRTSAFTAEYNDFWDNKDGDFLNCPPSLGIKAKKNKRGDSCDKDFNIFFNPVFFGSAAHKDSIDRDFKLATDTAKADVADKKLSRVIVQTVPDSIKKANLLNKPHVKWQLSPYSRLIDAGNPKSSFKDMDGTANDIGVLGGAEFSDN